MKTPTLVNNKRNDGSNGSVSGNMYKYLIIIFSLFLGEFGQESHLEILNATINCMFDFV